MLRKTPLKTKTPLKQYSTLRTKKPLRTKSPMRDWTAKAQKSNEEAVASNDTPKNQKPKRPRRTTPNYVSDMDKVFQYYVRLRDAMPGGYTKCISCGKIKPFDQMQAGHFFGRASFSTRWSEDNVHSECIWDNCYNGEHLLGYRDNLIKKIGQQRFNFLAVQRNKVKKWSDFEIQAMIVHYGKLCLQLSSSKKIHISKGVLDIIKRYDKRERNVKCKICGKEKPMSEY